MISVVRSGEHQAGLGAVLPLQHCAARAQRHADGDQISASKPNQDGITPSQTVGPYFAYGLTPNGKYDWNDAFTNNLVTPDTSGERIRIEGQGVRRRRRSRCRIACWRSGRPTRRAASPIRRTSARCRIRRSGVWPLRHRCQWRLCLRHHQAGRGARSRRQAAGAAYRARGVRARHAAASSTRGSISTARRPTPPIPVLALVPADRRATLIATRKPGSGNAVYRLDIHLQGDKETGVLRRVRLRPPGSCGMIIGRQQDVTVAATAVMERTSDPRLREIMVSLVKHLHGFVRDVSLTEAEFREAAAHSRRDRAGNRPTPHNEVVLMAGSLGVSSLVCLLNNGDQGNTETAQSLLGPFWRLNSPRVENGGSIVRSETPGAAAVRHRARRGPCRQSDCRGGGGCVARLAGRPLREPGS